MAGAIAGTAAVKLTDASDRLKLVTITVNNACNLQCPHCYLQYDGRRSFISEQTLTNVFSTSFEHLAIVGKEPLIDREASQLVSSITSRASSKGIGVSLITNGIGLPFLSPQTISELSYIDISFDGGPETYDSYRHGSYRALIAKINKLIAHRSCRINALNVLNDRTIDNIEDMLKVQYDVPVATILFSPYIPTQNNGVNFVSTVSIFRILEALSQSDKFMTSAQALLMLTRHELPDFPEEDDLRQKLETLGLDKKVSYIPHDPILSGIIRVTYDGIALSPLDSLHAKAYHDNGISLADCSLEEAFSLLGTKHLGIAHYVN